MENRMMKKNAARRYLDDIGWGLLFLMSGIILLVPGFPSPWGVWLVGVGVLLVGLNTARYALSVRPSIFMTGVGVVAMVAGVGEFLKLDLPILALGLLLVGVLILLKPLRNRKTS